MKRREFTPVGGAAVAWPPAEAARAGFGLAYLPDDQVEKHMPAGAEPDARAPCEPLAGHRLHYPSQRKSAP